MSRSIHIGYEDSNGRKVAIDIRSPYNLLGGQEASLAFWGLPLLKEIGIERLAILGQADPVYFYGWDEMVVLG
ncbi:MAG: hypothetical protein QM775_13755 [Pirellulales bacterium]